MSSYITNSDLEELVDELYKDKGEEVMFENWRKSKSDNITTATVVEESNYTSSVNEMLDNLDNCYNIKTGSNGIKTSGAITITTEETDDKETDDKETNDKETDDKGILREPGIYEEVKVTYVCPCCHKEYVVIERHTELKKNSVNSGKNKYDTAVHILMEEQKAEMIKIGNKEQMVCSECANSIKDLIFKGDN